MVGNPFDGDSLTDQPPESRLADRQNRIDQLADEMSLATRPQGGSERGKAFAVDGRGRLADCKVREPRLFEDVRR